MDIFVSAIKLYKTIDVLHKEKHHSELMGGCKNPKSLDFCLFLDVLFVIVSLIFKKNLRYSLEHNFIGRKGISVEVLIY